MFCLLVLYLQTEVVTAYSRKNIHTINRLRCFSTSHFFGFLGEQNRTCSQKINMLFFSSLMGKRNIQMWAYNFPNSIWEKTASININSSIFKINSSSLMCVTQNQVKKLTSDTGKHMLILKYFEIIDFVTFPGQPIEWHKLDGILSCETIVFNTVSL